MGLFTNNRGLRRRPVFRILLFSAGLLLAGCATTIPIDYDRTPSVALETPEQTELGSFFQAEIEAHPGKSGVVLIPTGEWDNATFLVAALLLHGRPLSFLRACRDGVDAAWGIILQFPFYAGIFGLMQNTALGPWLGDFFARLATTGSYPFVVYFYSGLMNLFVPSAGSKWLIEAPFLIPAGERLDVSVVTVLLAYSYGDSTTNLIQPFFAIPILAVTRMRFGDVVGYTALIALACFLTTTIALSLIPSVW